MLSWTRDSLVSFVLEESMSRTRIAAPTPGALSTFQIYRGISVRPWHDFRSEFEPIFTF